MMAALLIGAVAGLGCLGIVFGLRPTRPSLDALAATLSRPPQRPSGRRPGSDLRHRAITPLVEWLEHEDRSLGQWTRPLRPDLTITEGSMEELATKMVVGGGFGVVAPAALWVVALMAGASLPLTAVVVLSLGTGLAGLLLPMVELRRRAGNRRKHVRTVLGTFVDLVVLGLAGGMGVEGALLAASQVSSDWVVASMAKALATARDSGRSPWAALGRLGTEMGVGELVELATTLQLAGTEGARIRQSLSARAATLRRHEQAEAESDANTMTDRLFLPGALLLIGFLLFIGYPAFSRILGGF